jgi:3-oxoacyl-[acyl-carrier protein] reductase
MQTAKKLEGKVALVTGGSRSIGAAIAKRLCQDGAAVALTYSASKEKADEVVDSIAKSGGKAVAIKADAADSESVRMSVAKTMEAFGGLDILVNNAGILAISPIEKFSMEDFDRMIAVNVRGLFVATQEAARHMRDGGRIIHIGSCNSDRIPFGGASVYTLTKGAVAGFTKGLARDLGPRGITVNNVQPGPTDTDMNPGIGQFADLNRQYTALNRYGKVEEIASFVAYLASPEAGYITGASLLVDGGYSA